MIITCDCGNMGFEAVLDLVHNEVVLHCLACNETYKTSIFITLSKTTDASTRKNNI